MSHKSSLLPMRSKLPLHRLNAHKVELSHPPSPAQHHATGSSSGGPSSIPAAHLPHAAVNHKPITKSIMNGQNFPEKTQWKPDIKISDRDDDAAINKSSLDYNEDYTPPASDIDFDDAPQLTVNDTRMKLSKLKKNKNIIHKPDSHVMKKKKQSQSVLHHDREEKEIPDPDQEILIIDETALHKRNNDIKLNKHQNSSKNSEKDVSLASTHTATLPKVPKAKKAKAQSIDHFPLPHTNAQQQINTITSASATLPSPTINNAASHLPLPSLFSSSSPSSLPSLISDYFQHHGMHRTLYMYQCEYQDLSQIEMNQQQNREEKPKKEKLKNKKKDHKSRVDSHTITTTNSSLAASNNLKRNNNITRLRRAFENLDAHTFFKLLATTSPSTYASLVHNTGHDDFLFFLHVYFFITPPVKSRSSSSPAREFANFLTTYPPSSSLLPFYALPYINNPKQHEQLAFLFEKKWGDDIQRRVEDMISNIENGNDDSNSHGKTMTKLEKIIAQSEQVNSNTNNNNNNNSNNNLSSSNSSSISASPPRDRRSSVSSMPTPARSTTTHNSPSSSHKKRVVAAGLSAQDISRKDLHDALGMASKLGHMLSLLQMDIGSQSQALSQVELNDLHTRLEQLSIRSSSLQQLFTLERKQNELAEKKAKLESESAASRKSMLEEPSKSDQKTSPHLKKTPSLPTFSSNNNERNQATFGFPDLNYDSIIQTLKSGSASDKSTLLQSLRWRLTRSPASVRRRHFSAFIEQDILRINSEILEDMLTYSSKNEKLKLDGLVNMVRFINILSSFLIGRAYLLKQSNLISLLFNVVKTQQHDTVARQHALGALQKFSLSRSAQSQMIRLGVIEWCVVHILKQAALSNDDRTLSDYSLEYGTALLMNLSLRSAGKIRCEQSLQTTSDLLPALYKCLQYDELQFRTYINGTLYSILSRRKLRIRARQLGMIPLLQSIRSKVDARIQQQFDYILRILETNEENDEKNVPEDDGIHSEDDDDAEPESVSEKPGGGDGEEEEEEDIVEIDDEEEEAKSVEQGNGSKKGEMFLSSFYLNDSVFSTSPNRPDAGAPVPLSVASAPSSARSVHSRIDVIDEDASPRPSSPSLPSGSNFFPSPTSPSQRIARTPAFPILRATTPSSKNRNNGFYFPTSPSLRGVNVNPTNTNVRIAPPASLAPLATRPRNAALTHSPSTPALSVGKPLVPPLDVAKSSDRRIPAPSVQNPPESLTRYYKAFQTRPKVGRTPMTTSLYAHPNEFDMIKRR